MQTREVTPLARTPRPAAQPQPNAPANAFAGQISVTEIRPPAATQPVPATMALKPVAFSQLLNTFKMRKSIPIAQLRAQPIITMGVNRYDFRRMLDNPQALTGVAQRLRARPQLATVLAETVDVVETDRGMLVHNYLSYRLKPGACTNAGRAAQLRQAGGQCPAPITDDSRAKAMADPNDAHYYPDSKKRAAVLFKSSIQTAKQAEAIRKYVPQLRANLATPAGSAQIGAAEAARLAALNDNQLLEEIASTAVVNSEEITLVPLVDIAPKPFLSKLNPTPYKATFAGAGKGPAPVTGHHALSTQYFLTGFTTGRNFEWRKRAEVTIDWCLVGCSETYYAEVYATFDYAFGLRFPIQMTGTYDFKDNMAFVTPVFTPINGTAKQYEATGLAADQIYGGKEFVAEVGFSAGLNYKVPILGADGVGLAERLDFTDYLEKPFKGGEVLPPGPGQSSEPMLKVIDQIDLIGGRADFGVAGARVHPVIELKLQSTDLHFTLHDTGNGNNYDRTVKSGEQTRLMYDAKTRVSHFSLGDPTYTLEFVVTPGIRPKLFVDVGVWEYDWHTDVMFPQFAIKLPPGGATFSCHNGTVCSRNYEFSPEAASESAGATAKSYRFETSELGGVHWYWGKAAPDPRSTWANAFDEKFFAMCPPKTKDVYNFCGLDLWQIRINALLLMSVAPVQSQEKYKSMKASPFMPQQLIDEAIKTDAMKRVDDAAKKADADATAAVEKNQAKYP